MSDYKADAKASRKTKMRAMGCYADGGDVGTKFTDIAKVRGPLNMPDNMKELDPGETWGGLDKNNIQPNDVMAPKPLQEDT